MDTVSIREERAGQESVLDAVHLDGRAGAGPGGGHGDGSAVVGMITGAGVMRTHPSFNSFHRSA